MLLVPKTGLPDPRAVALVPEPSGRSRIARCAVEIAEETDAVSFDIRALAFGARLVVDLEPQKRHLADHRGDLLLQWDFRFACLSAGGGALPQVSTAPDSWLRMRAVPTRRRKIEPR